MIMKIVRSVDSGSELYLKMRQVHTPKERGRRRLLRDTARVVQTTSKSTKRVTRLPNHVSSTLCRHHHHPIQFTHSEHSPSELSWFQHSASKHPIWHQQVATSANDWNLLLSIRTFHPMIHTFYRTTSISQISLSICPTRPQPQLNSSRSSIS